MSSPSADARDAEEGSLTAAAAAAFAAFALASRASALRSSRRRSILCSAVPSSAALSIAAANPAANPVSCPFVSVPSSSPLFSASVCETNSPPALSPSNDDWTSKKARNAFFCSSRSSMVATRSKFFLKMRSAVESASRANSSRLAMSGGKRAFSRCELSRKKRSCSSPRYVPAPAPVIRWNTSSLTSRSTGSRNVVLAMNWHPSASARVRSRSKRFSMPTMPNLPQWCAMSFFPGLSACGTTNFSQ